MSRHQKVSPGQRIKRPSASFRSDLIDALDWIAGQRSRTGALTETLGDQAGIVPVLNTTGGVLDQFAVIGLGTPINDDSENLEEFQQRPTFKATKPSDAGGYASGGVWSQIGILLEPLPANAVGMAVVDGIAITKIEVGNAADAYATVIHEDTTALRSSNHGLPILWKQSGTGSGKWAIVRLGPPFRFCRFELKTALGNSVSAIAYPLRWTGSDVAPDTSVELRIYGPYREAVYTEFFGRGRDATNGIPGARGVALWAADMQRWEVLYLAPPARSIHFQLTEDMDHTDTAANAKVLNHYNGYDPSPAAVDANRPIVVSNAYGGPFSGHSGDRGVAMLLDGDGHYQIVAMEPTDADPATFDVVVRVTATAYYTRQLRLPKGCTWGAEVEHLAGFGGADAFQ